MALSYTYGTLTQVEEVEGGWEGGYPGPGVRLFWEEVSVQCISVSVPKPSPTVKIVSVSHTQNQVELRTLSNVEHGAQPQDQHYECSHQSLAWGMGD